jgi:hypothetical protein
MVEHTFKPGDLVRNINENSVHYPRIKDKIGIFKGYWDECYTLRAACDVSYSSVVDLYGRDNLAQSADDLEPVANEFRPSSIDPFDWIVDGREVRVSVQWRSCGHKETRGTDYVRCMKCYPASGKVYQSHGPYYEARYCDQDGKRKRKYLGATLPPLPDGVQIEQGESA